MDNGSVYEKETIQSVRERVRVCQRDGEYIYIYLYGVLLMRNVLILVLRHCSQINSVCKLRHMQIDFR